MISPSYTVGHPGTMMIEGEDAARDEKRMKNQRVTLETVISTRRCVDATSGTSLDCDEFFITKTNIACERFVCWRGGFWVLSIITS